MIIFILLLSFCFGSINTSRLTRRPVMRKVLPSIRIRNDEYSTEEEQSVSNKPVLSNRILREFPVVPLTSFDFDTTLPPIREDVDRDNEDRKKSRNNDDGIRKEEEEFDPFIPFEEKTVEEDCSTDQEINTIPARQAIPDSLPERRRILNTANLIASRNTSRPVLTSRITITIETSPFTRRRSKNRSILEKVQKMLADIEKRTTK